MSDEKSQQQEPTMEEILASIRRIISENDEDGAKGAEKPAEPRLDAAPSQPDPHPAPAAEPVPAAPAAGKNEDEEEILELTEVVEEPNSEAAKPDEAKDDDVVIADPETAPDPEPAPVPPPAAACAGSRLVSEVTESAASATLGALARELNRDAGTAGNIPIGPGNTLEDLVKDMIRPMLKEWLDQNLPTLVERLVRKEIERMVRRAEDDDY